MSTKKVVKKIEGKRSIESEGQKQASEKLAVPEIQKSRISECKTESFANSGFLKKEAGQNKYIQLQMIDQQARQLQQYLQTFDQQLLEIRSVIGSLNELAKLKKGDSILAPIANGIFIKAKLDDNQEVKVNVGNNTVVTKTVEGAIKMLEGQEAEITQYRSDVLAKFDELLKQAEILQGE